MQTKVRLDENEIPTRWYNVVADMPNPPAPVLGPDALSAIFPDALIELAAPQLPTFEAGVTFACTEGIIPAPESNYAIRAAIDEALSCKETGELEDFAYPDEAIEEALHHLPKVDLG